MILRFIFALSYVALTGCATPTPQYVEWKEVCPVGGATSVSLQVPVGGSLTAGGAFGNYSAAFGPKSCNLNKRVPAPFLIGAGAGFQLAKTEDAYFHEGGILWVPPQSPDYRQLTQNLTPAIFPHNDLASCIRAGDCLNFERD